MLITYGVVLCNIDSSKDKTAIVVRPKKERAIIVYTKLNTSLVRRFHSSCYRKVDEFRDCPTTRGDVLMYEDLNEEAKEQNTFKSCISKTPHSNFKLKEKEVI